MSPALLGSFRDSKGFIPRATSILLRCFAISKICFLAVGCQTSDAATVKDEITRNSIPNIVFILADDIGWRDTEVYGSQFYQTPNLKDLAESGITFTEAYATNPLCSPTRASLLTGLHPARLRLTAPAGHRADVILDPVVPETAPAHRKMVEPQTRTRLPNSYETLAERLKGAGYVTAFFGKWHLGRHPYLPEMQGFDRVVGGRHHAGPPGGYFSPWEDSNIPWRNDGEHVSDRLSREVALFIRNNRHRKFAIFYWDYSIHAPFQAKAALAEKYARLADPSYPQRNPTVGAMVETLDSAVGRVIGELKNQELLRDTFVVFTSDNGGNVHRKINDVPVTSNHPLRNGKGSLYDGGLKVPLIVSWPRRIVAGSVQRSIVSSVDFFPTIAEIAGVPVTAGQVDGESFFEQLINPSSRTTKPVFAHFPHYIDATEHRPGTAVRLGNWKLIRRFGEGRNRSNYYELYHLFADPSERENVAANYPLKKVQLENLISRHLYDTNALIPKQNPNYSIP